MLPVDPKTPMPHPELELRLGRVTAGSYIRENIIYRSSEFEVGFYDDLLWTERPDAYLRRALAEVLFEQEHLRSAVSGPVPVLDVELLNFEEVRAPRHIARVRLTFLVHDDRSVRIEQTLAVECPIKETPKAQATAAIAAALGDAMTSAVFQLSERVIAELGHPATASPGAAPREAQPTKERTNQLPLSLR
jgi:cholesterol transport system auxiliary component